MFGWLHRAKALAIHLRYTMHAPSQQAGTFSVGPANTTISPPPGSTLFTDYYPAPGAATCTPCAPGTFSFPGSSTCLPCSPGMHAPEAGASVCAPCAAGNFSSGVCLAEAQALLAVKLTLFCMHAWSEHLECTEQAWIHGWLDHFAQLAWTWVCTGARMRTLRRRKR